MDEDEADEEEDEDRGRGDIMVLPRCYNWQEIRINGADGGEPSGMQPGNLKNLSERIDMLSNPKHSEHMVNDDSVLVETLPPEVLFFFIIIYIVLFMLIYFAFFYFTRFEVSKLSK